MTEILEPRLVVPIAWEFINMETGTRDVLLAGDDEIARRFGWPHDWMGKALVYSEGSNSVAFASAGGMNERDLIQALQEALSFWMPSIAGRETPDGARAAQDSYLLYGMEGSLEEDCYGDRILAIMANMPYTINVRLGDEK